MRQYVLFFFLLALLPQAILAQQGQVEFGKNRVQYHKRFDVWMKYESRNFITTWYGTGRKIGETATLLAEADLPYIKEFLEYNPSTKIRIIVYTDLSDLKQTNIGSEEQFTNTAGHTLIRENKIFIYFNGDHQHLRKQIREGLVKVFIQNMIVGESWQEMVQNAALLNLPEWYTEGLASFVSDEWTPELSLWLKAQLDDNKDFFEIAREYPKRGGHAMFYYLDKIYGRPNLSNLIYLTRLNRSLETGFVHVYGNSLDDVEVGWKKFYEQQFDVEEKNRQPFSEEHYVAIKNKHKVPMTQLKLSPDGSHFAYVQNEIGKVKVYIQNLETGKRKMIFKKGFRNPFQSTDYNYPCIAWRPDSKGLDLVYKYRDVIYLSEYDVGTNKMAVDEFAPGFQNIHSIDFLDGQTLAISASVNGYSDVFLYYPSKRQASRITSDIWDDLDVKVTHLANGRGLLFVSNRPDSLLRNRQLDSILPIGDFDVFYYNLDSMGKELVQLTHTPYANERSPIDIDSTWFGYLSDRSGVYNQEVGYLKEQIVAYHKNYLLKDGQQIIIPRDSVLVELDTALVDTMWIEPIWRPQAFVHSVSNYGHNIISQTYSNGVYLNFFRKGNQLIVGHDSLSLELKQLSISFYKNKSQSKSKAVIGHILEKQEDTISEANYHFVTPFGKMNESQQEQDRLAKASVLGGNARSVYMNPGPVQPFKQARITPKKLRFRLDYLITQADNNLLFEGLDSYAGTPGEFSTPPVGILMKANFKDLFEDYEIEGGLRFNLTFNKLEYFMQYWDRKHRIDRQYGIYLKKTSSTNNNIQSFIPQNTKNQSIIATSQWRYPFDIYRSLRATTTMRFDRFLKASTESVSLRSPIIKEKRVGVKLAYVFDNTLDVYTNIKNGTRYKVYAEIVKKYNIDFIDNFEFSLSDGFMGVIGVDARHYQRLVRHSIFASRLAGATSFGSEKLLYIMGGTNNWLLPQYDQNTPIPEDNFAYRTLAANMRGFRQNIRNGSSFLMTNQELRIPLFRYISRHPLKSSFFNNIQLVGFVDAGLAWSGKDPFGFDSPLNTRVVFGKDASGVPVSKITVKYFRDPTVLGYGVGLRTMLFGYFVRADYAWGVETKTILKPKFYLSLGTDF